MKLRLVGVVCRENARLWLYLLGGLLRGILALLLMKLIMLARLVRSCIGIRTIVFVLTANCL